MGILPWDLGAVFSSPEPVRTPRLTIRCEYPDTNMLPTEVTFGLSPSYGIHTARDSPRLPSLPQRLRRHDPQRAQRRRGKDQTEAPQTVPKTASTPTDACRRN